jgi:uncharacterized protein involved in oxidation of intracellular sulfur
MPLLRRWNSAQGSFVNVLIIINGSAYGQDSTFNGIRLAGSLVRRESVQTTVFLMGDGVTSAIRGQQTPDGYYKLDRMLGAVARRGEVLACATCMDARGITDEMLIDGAMRSSLDVLTDRTLDADKVLTF